ncbi:hypothetical protein [Alteromonas sp. KUL49]|uniref:hypothetical protein n=1 Tax=Alteromonas sp. KUL49 TaxID=2480798 RepID=UPI00102EF853|nr:hypothetical protein [Alteromonas sp. KUL49]TAP39427.1 hypothetical protein EYS00_12905 [Alteromonas sp. KUL49]GEA12224.1 hypothetical protein KUL49_25990 [Alteromonas sp. KUL49]
MRRSLCWILGIVVIILAGCSHDISTNSIPEKLENVTEAPHVSYYDYDSVSSYHRSNLFSVTVGGRPIDLLLTTPPSEAMSPKLEPGKQDGADVYRQNNRSFSWGQFDFDASYAGVAVTATKNVDDGFIRDIIVRPTQLEGIAYEIVEKDLVAKTIRINVLQSNRKLSIEFVDERYSEIQSLPFDALLLFADQPQSKDIASALNLEDPKTYLVKDGSVFDRQRAESASSVIFEPGLHDIGLWFVPESVSRIHIEGGAYVRGALNGDHDEKSGRSGFHVTGRGVLSGELFQFRADVRTNGEAVCVDDNGYSAGCPRSGVKPIDANQNNFLIEGITMVNIPFYALGLSYDKDIPLAQRSGIISNIKMLGMWRYNNDGFALPDNVVVEDCFVSAMDDAFKVYNHNATVRDCVVWQMDNGAIFQFGWFPKSVNKALIENIHVIHTEWTGLNKNRGLANLTERPAGNSNAGEISDITFRNVYMEGPVSRVVYLKNGLYPNQSYSRWYFENINVERLFPYDQMVLTKRRYGGNGQLLPTLQINAIQDFNLGSGNIEDIYFNGLYISGERVTMENAGNVGVFDINVDNKDVVQFE